VTQVRKYDYLVGVEASAQPDAGTPTLPNDLITLSYFETMAAGKRKIVSTYLAPTLVDAGTAINPTVEALIDEYLQFIAGNGASQDMSANPQVTAPGRAGIRLTLVGTSDANYVLLENGNGLALNGPCELGDKDSITLISIDATTWQEESRS
jgi:hypothetical protein